MILSMTHGDTRLKTLPVLMYSRKQHLPALPSFKAAGHPGKRKNSPIPEGKMSLRRAVHLHQTVTTHQSHADQFPISHADRGTCPAQQRTDCDHSVPVP